MHNNSKTTLIRLNDAIGIILISAGIAAFVGAIWVAHYLLTTQIGGVYFGTRLLDFVTGAEFNMQGNNGSDALFVVVTRFMLATACLWMPITAGLLFLRTLFTSSINTIQPKAEAIASAEPASILESDR